MFPGPQALLSGGWQDSAELNVTVEDVRLWFFSVGSSIKLVAFLSSLHWPSEFHDLGSGGISLIELLILDERWTGGSLVPEKYFPKFRRPGRPISVSAAPEGPGTDTWKLCQHLAGMLRAKRLLLGGTGRLIPGRIGANHGMLWHTGGEKR